MNYTSLTPLEIRDLIAKYRSDLRKLEFQVNKTTQILKELQSHSSDIEEALSIEEAEIKELPTVSASEAASEPDVKETAKKTAKPSKGKGRKAAGKKRGPGRPPKTENKKKRAKSESKKDKGYRLSEWDEFVINSLQAKQKALITSDFSDIAKGNPDIKAGDAQVKVKLNRSLHKLANKKGILVKVEYPGRGYAYALADWLNNKGELPKKYAR